MRRLFTILAAVGACVLGVPAVAHAAVEPLGSGAGLYNLFGPGNRQCTAAFAATDGGTGFLVAGPTCPSGDLWATNSAGSSVLVGTASASALPYNGWTLVKVTNTKDWALVPYVPAGK